MSNLDQHAIEADAERALSLRLASGKVMGSDGVVSIEGLTINADRLEVGDDQCSAPILLKKGANTYTINYSWEK